MIVPHNFKGFQLLDSWPHLSNHSSQVISFTWSLNGPSLYINFCQQMITVQNIPKQAMLQLHDILCTKQRISMTPAACQYFVVIHRLDAPRGLQLAMISTSMFLLVKHKRKKNSHTTDLLLITTLKTEEGLLSWIQVCTEASSSLPKTLVPCACCVPLQGVCHC